MDSTACDNIDRQSGGELRLGTSRARFRTILVGMDFSGPAMQALHTAVSLAQRFEGKLILVHAVPPVVYGPGATMVTPELLDIDVNNAREEMHRILSTIDRGQVRCKIVVKIAEATDLIEEVVRTQGVDLVVVGSHGAHGLEKLALGSTAEDVFRKSSCPVLITGPNCTKILASIDSIVFATDLEIGAFRPAQYASALAEEVNARLTLLHVSKPGLHHADTPEKLLKAQLAKKLRQLLPGDAELWCRPNVRVEFGNSSEEILRVADSESADLIVVGVRENVTMGDHAPWSRTSQVIQNAKCPVLGVRCHLVQG
jgi:nucleotide-binding universal stress UspA family protein